jgi:hypothetical protein
MLTYCSFLSLRVEIEINNILKFKIMETLFFLVIAVSLAYAVGCWGRTRKIGFGLAFVLSLVNLLVGIIAVACSKKIDNVNNKEENV